MSLTVELRNSIEQVYLFKPSGVQLRSLGIPQDYVKKVDEEIKKLLDDEELKNGTLEVMSGLFSYLTTLDIDDLTKIEDFMKKYPAKLQQLDNLYKLLENLPAEEYKEYWLGKYYGLLDKLVKAKEEFMRTIEEREGVNTIMEFYYKVFLGLLTDLVENIRRYETVERLKARDDAKLRALMSTTNTLIFVLSYPIIAYLEGDKLDYEILTYLITIFAKPSTIKDKYSEIIGEALFG